MSGVCRYVVRDLELDGHDDVHLVSHLQNYDVMTCACRHARDCLEHGVSAYYGCRSGNFDKTLLSGLTVMSLIIVAQNFNDGRKALKTVNRLSQ